MSTIAQGTSVGGSGVLSGNIQQVPLKIIPPVGIVKTYDSTTGQGTIEKINTDTLVIMGVVNEVASDGPIVTATFVQKGEAIKVGEKYTYTLDGTVASNLVPQ